MGENSRKTGLVMSGGGADSAYAVGVVKALCSGRPHFLRGQDFDPEVVTGTSAGAYNAALLVSVAEKAGFGAAAARLEEIWLDDLAGSLTSCGNGVYRVRGFPLEYFNPFCLLTQPFQQAAELVSDASFLGVDSFLRGVKAATMDGPLISRFINVASLEPLVTNDPLEETIHQTVDFSVLAQSSRALRIVTTNWNYGTPRIFRNRQMVGQVGCLAVMASAALPGIFPPVQIEDCLYVDGGLLQNTPLKPAIHAGADDLYVIYFDPNVANIPIDVLSSTVDSFYRSLVILWASKINQDVAMAGIINRSILRLQEALPANRREMQRLVRKIHDRREDRDYKLLNIHRIHPHDNLGGTLGFLNFNKERIEGLIQRGYQDTLAHDCSRSRCLLADQDFEVLYETTPRRSE